MHRGIGVFIIGIALALVALACGDDRQPSPNPGARAAETAEAEPTPTATTAQTSPASLRVPAGESGSLEHGSGARMEIPPGALTEAVTVSITEVEPPPSPVKTGRVYDFSVGEDTLILAPITLHIPFEIEPGGDSSRILPLHWDEELEVWVVLEGEVDESGGTVAVTVLDLSRFTTAGGEARAGTSSSTAGLEVQPMIVEIEAPETVVVGESFDVHWTVQNTGPSDLFDVDEEAVGYVRLLSPTETEVWRRKAASDARIVLDWLGQDAWRVGHSYTSSSSRGSLMNPVTITPSEVGPLTIRVELVFENGNGDLIGRDVVEDEVLITTQHSFPATTVIVDGREYRVSGEADSRGVTEYLVEDVENSARVGGSLRDKAVFTAHVQHVYRTPESIRFTKIFTSSLWNFADYANYFGIWISSDVTFGLGAATGITSILISPNVYGKVKATANLSVNVVTKMIKEMTDNPEKTTEEVGLKAIRESRDLLKEMAELAKEIQGGRSLSFAEAVFLEDADTYGASYQGPAADALLMIAKENLRIPEEALKTAGAVATEHLSGLPATDALELVELLSVLEGLNDPLAEYEPWQVMASGIKANLAAERVKHAKLLDSLGISDHEPFQLPVLTGFTITTILPTAPAPTPTPASQDSRPETSDRAGTSATFASVSAGGEHTCGVKLDGSVQCWGSDVAGQATPPGGVFASVSAGMFHTCGVKTNGFVQCWGRDDYGQSTPPAGEFASVNAGGEHTCGMMPDGSVQCWGYDGSGQSTPPAGEFASVSAGGEHTCGVKPDGFVQCWGSDGSGQSTPPAGEFASVSAGLWHTCGVKLDGSVQCWGSDGSGQSTPPAGEFASVSAGHVHTCGVKPDGSVQCWGWDELFGQSTPPAGEFASVSAGDAHTCGVKLDGSVQCWGGDWEGQSTPPGAPTPVVTLAPASGRIAFHSHRSGADDIYVMNADGSGETRLTDNSTHDSVPSWSP